MECNEIITNGVSVIECVKPIVEPIKEIDTQQVIFGLSMGLFALLVFI